jgi:hypothetical protein
LPANQAQNFGVTFAINPADMTASVKPGAVLQVLDHLRYTDQITKIVSVDAANSAPSPSPTSSTPEPARRELPEAGACSTIRPTSAQRRVRIRCRDLKGLS